MELRKKIEKVYAHATQKISELSERMVLFGIFGLLFLELAVLCSATRTYWWDETIYIGMAKYIYTLGGLGFWESFRPLGYPLLIGLLWKIGMPIAFIKSILPFVFSGGILVLTYLISEKIMKGSGVMSAIFLGATSLFVRFSNAMLSDVASTFFGMLALYLFTKKKNYLSGLMAGYAFLIRFPNGIALLGIGIPLLYYCVSDWRNIKAYVTRGITVILGFATIALPFLAFNFYRYNDLFKPFKDARLMMDIGLWQYDLGPWFFVKELLKQNAILVFVAVFLCFYFLRSGLRRNELLNQTIAIGILAFAYFTNLAHKEDRYIFIGLPFLVILSGIAIVLLIKKYWPSTEQKNVYNSSIGVLVFINVIVFISVLRMIPIYPPEQIDFYHTFDSEKEGLLLATNPLFLVFTDKPTEFLVTWDYANSIFERFAKKVDAIAVNTCEYNCDSGDPGKECREGKEKFLERISKYQLVKKSTWQGCDLLVYKVE